MERDLLVVSIAAIQLNTAINAEFSMRSGYSASGADAGLLEIFIRARQHSRRPRDVAGAFAPRIGMRADRMFERHFVAYGVRIGLCADSRALLDTLEHDPVHMHLPFGWRAVEHHEPDARVSVRDELLSGVGWSVSVIPCVRRLGTPGRCQAKLCSSQRWRNACHVGRERGQACGCS
jgi:hypothetical protein